MKVKDGVQLDRLNPMLRWPAVLYDYARQFAGYGEGTITSGTEGAHSATSKHYEGKAVDLRTNDLPGGAQGTVARSLGEWLQKWLDWLCDYWGIAGFVVIVEDDHIHVHWLG